MSRTRRAFVKDFKAKVVLEALKEKDIMKVLAEKYELVPNQISVECGIHTESFCGFHGRENARCQR